MSTIEALLRSGRMLLMDGAMGTELQRTGGNEANCFELWNVNHPHRVGAVHRAYVAAGAELLLTNTFQANPPRLAKVGAANQLHEIFRAGIELARSAAGPDRAVVASVGPFDHVDATTALSITRAAENADALLLETWSDPESVRFFVDAMSAKVGSLPLLVSFTFRRSEPGLCTFTNHLPEDCAQAAAKYGAIALGVNCGRGMHAEDYVEIVGRYRAVTDLPLFVRPNAGTPERSSGAWSYPVAPDALAAGSLGLLAKVRMLGGCCGTTPTHIAALRAVVDKWNARAG